MRRLIPILLFAAQILFSAHPSFAQSPTASSSCPCTLHGSVVDSVSGQPVPHALVKLTAPSPHAALTDPEGKFQFEGLPAGSVTLEAGKPGFLDNSGVNLWAGEFYSFQFGPGSAPALLKLIPEGVISGQVSDENGEPLEGFTVSVLYRSSYDNRFYPDQRRSAAITSDEGKFRIAGLHLGSYYLVARPAQSPVPNSSAKSSIPSGYSSVFYPGANEPTSAVPLKLLPGRTVQANFSLKRGPFIRLSGTVSGYAPQERVFMMLQDSSGTTENGEILFDSSTGSFHTKWIPPGTYTLTAESQISNSVDALRAVSFARQHVNANSSLSSLRLVLQPTVNIPIDVRVRPAANSAEQQSLALQLFITPKDIMPRDAIPFVPSANRDNPQISGDSSGIFARVTPGAYQLGFAVGSNSSSCYIASASWGSVDLLRDDLVLEDSSSVPRVEVVFQDDAATLNGSVVSGGHPAPSMVVLLSDKRTRTRFLSAGADGRFTFSEIPPDTYRVFAAGIAVNFDYQDPAFLAKISSKIQEITLAPKQSASINLELAMVEE